MFAIIIIIMKPGEIRGVVVKKVRGVQSKDDLAVRMNRFYYHYDIDFVKYYENYAEYFVSISSREAFDVI